MPLLPLDPAIALPDAPRGFLRDLIESHLLAIVFGVSALVLLGLWLDWQLSSLQASDASASPINPESHRE
jgi:hypothetical protein